MTLVTRDEVQAWMVVLRAALRPDYLPAYVEGFNELPRLAQLVVAAFTADDATKSINVFEGVPSDIALRWAQLQKLDLDEFKEAYRTWAHKVVESVPGGGRA